MANNRTDMTRADEERRTYLADTYGYTPGQINVMRAVICLAATDEELEFFLAVCKRTQLDPFSRQIYFVKRRQRTGEDDRGNAKYADVGRPETSIDGLRTIAERSGEYEGQAATLWCGNDGRWSDVWLKQEPPAAAKTTVFRAKHREPLVSVALFSEYAPKFSNGQMPAMWQKMPANQLAKCSEAAGLRRAFPRDLSGLYTDDEMEHTIVAAANAFAAPDVVKDATKKTIDVAADVGESKAVIEHAALQLEEAKTNAFAKLTDEQRMEIEDAITLVRNAESRDELKPFGAMVSRARAGKKRTAAEAAFDFAVDQVVAPEIQKRWDVIPPTGAK